MTGEKVEKQNRNLQCYLNLPSVYPAEVRPEVTAYLVQLPIFYIKWTETTTQLNCITNKGHRN